MDYNYNKKTEDDVVVDGKPYEDDVMVAAVTAGGGGGATDTVNIGPPIPVGHARFYCSKCRTPYDLPDKATSWRCANCMEFNSIAPGECPACTIS